MCNTKGDQEYEVERIVEKWIRDGNEPQYLVRWKGFQPKDDTWHLESDLRNCSKLIAEFNARNSSKWTVPPKNKKTARNKK